MGTRGHLKCKWFFQPTRLYFDQHLRLSDELYSKPAHCVLEIVQNAADNLYDADVQPTLELELTESFMQIWCNETGFSEANVKAFCSIGNSTKKKKKGYIGMQLLPCSALVLCCSSLWT